jgi:hypothetical protein
MVIGPHHAAVTHVGHSSEVGQREHMVRLGIHRKCWSEFMCLGDYLAQPRQVGGRAQRDAPDRHPSADPRRWHPAGGPAAGAQLGIEPIDAKRLWYHAGYRLVSADLGLGQRQVICSSACFRGEVGATDHNLQPALRVVSHHPYVAVGSSNGRS